MNDHSATLAQLKQEVQDFVSERDWQQFHAPKNLAMSISIEAAELMEHFQWLDSAASRKHNLAADQLHLIGEELADVLAYCLALANELQIDLSDALIQKMAKNREKYPADEFRGKY